MRIKELENGDFEILKSNLKKRRRTFAVISKRERPSIIVDGAVVASMKRDSNLSSLKTEKEKNEVLAIFANVKKSFTRYIKDNGNIVETVPELHDSTWSNPEIVEMALSGDEFWEIDVRHCYWRIAYNLGYISEPIYQNLVDRPTLKLYRNMSLSCVVAPKVADYYIDGELFITIEEDNSLYDRMYRNIRHTAWNLMGQIVHSVGSENVAMYRTDGIVVRPEVINKACVHIARKKLKYRVRRKDISPKSNSN